MPRPASVALALAFYYDRPFSRCNSLSVNVMVFIGSAYFIYISRVVPLFRASGFAPVSSESMTDMARGSYLAGIDSASVNLLRVALAKSGAPAFEGVVPINVSNIGKSAAELLVCDIDDLDADPLETLRRLRFVLPDCIIAVFTGVLTRPWARACHLAGANCLLLKDSSEQQLAAGLRGALSSGCFTDPRFSVAYGAA